MKANLSSGGIRILIDPPLTFTDFGKLDSSIATPRVKVTQLDTMRPNDKSTNILTSPQFICRDRDLLFQPFLESLEGAVSTARASGFRIGIFETWRSPQRQEFLYGAPKPVTKARAWKSWHQYGLAADIAFLKDDGRTWTWEGEFTKVAQIFKDFDLEWGGPGDAGHYQLSRGLHIEMAQAMCRTYGLQRLWMEIKTLGKGKP